MQREMYSNFHGKGTKFTLKITVSLCAEMSSMDLLISINASSGGVFSELDMKYSTSILALLQ